MNETIQYDEVEYRLWRTDSQSNQQQQKETMCWKDPYKVCKCERPQLGVFCERYPIPTD